MTNLYQRLIKINPESAHIAANFQYELENSILRAFVCDRCGAQPWVRCVSKNGRLSSRSHVAREIRARNLVADCIPDAPAERWTP